MNYYWCDLFDILYKMQGVVCSLDLFKSLKIKKIHLIIEHGHLDCITQKYMTHCYLCEIDAQDRIKDFTW